MTNALVFGLLVAGLAAPAPAPEYRTPRIVVDVAAVEKEMRLSARLVWSAAAFDLGTTFASSRGESNPATRWAGGNAKGLTAAVKVGMTFAGLKFERRLRMDGHPVWGSVVRWLFAGSGFVAGAVNLAVGF